MLRGTTTDVFGQVVDDDTAIAPGLGDIAASIIETSKEVFDPADQTLRTVRKLTGRIQGDVALLEGDRIKDLRTGEVYIVDEDTRAPRSISGRSSVTLSLRRTGG